MRELIPEMPEIRLIDTKRTSIVPAAEPEKPVQLITGRQYRRMLRKLAFLLGVSMGWNVVMAVALWIAQAGPI